MGRSTGGCWTCRVRRKKCDEKHPVCQACATLQITCDYDATKPDWMDGSVKQNAMSRSIKRTIRERAPFRRRADYQTNIPGERYFELAASSRHDFFSAAAETTVPSQETSGGSATVPTPSLEALSLIPARSSALSPPGCQQVARILPSNHTDSILLVFYLENVLPYMFPFYRHSLLVGGKAWTLDLIASSPVMRLSTLFQSSYFYALALGKAECDKFRESALIQAQDAFVALLYGTQLVKETGVLGHTGCAVRIVTAIVQIQRFEIALGQFNHCQSRLKAAITLLQQLLECTSGESACSGASFHAVFSLLGNSHRGSTFEWPRILNVAQTAFCFSLAYVLYDDIIASTIFQDDPRLYEHHRYLLCANDSTDSRPMIDLEHTVGCQNWVLVGIGQIAALNAWKQRGREDGDFDAMQLVNRAHPIRVMLETHMTQLDAQPVSWDMQDTGSLVDCILAAQHGALSIDRSSQQSSRATRMWAHAALLYLAMTASGWQPVDVDVRFHVSQVIELMSSSCLSPTSMRTMAWPFCVAGCFAEVSQTALFRRIADGLQPASMFSSMHRALKIMENVWQDREKGAVGEFASYFRSGDELFLLV